MPRSIEQMIGQHVERWEREHGVWAPSPEDLEENLPPARPAIALAPQLGAGSRYVADILSRRMNYEIFGFTLIDKVAENMNVRRQLVDRLDQRIKSTVRGFVEGLLHGRHIHQSEYFRHLLQVLRVFALEGGCILLGRGAPFVVDPGRGIRVRITAPESVRIANLVKIYHITDDEARTRMTDSDRERRQFVEKFYGKDIDDPLEYDLCINMERQSPETAVAMILEALNAMRLMEAPRKVRLRRAPRSAEEVIERQIYRWDTRRAAAAEGEEEAGHEGQQAVRLPVVAFQPQFCSGSRLISEVLQSRLDYEIFGYRLIDKVAEDLDLSPRIVDRLDQRAKSAISAMIEGMRQGRTINRQEYFESLVRVVRALVVQGGVILIGRGSPLMVERNEGLRIRLVAPFDKRVENIKAFYGLDDETATDRLNTGDHERAGFIHQYFDAGIDDLNRYDITMNMDRLTPTAGADVIERGMEPMILWPSNRAAQPSSVYMVGDGSS